MPTGTLDPVRAAAIERELSAIGTSTSGLQRGQRRSRLVIGVGVIALAGAVTGGAILAGGLPGETRTTPLEGTPVTGSFSGTASVELGPVPERADAVVLDITCTDGGEMSVALNGSSGGDSLSWNCGDDLGDQVIRIPDAELPPDGATAITVNAEPGTEWSVTARYASSITSSWGVNANGETYGVGKADGLPDLEAAMATNGRQGYLRHEESNSFTYPESGWINVYQSDGITVIGQFPIGDVYELPDLTN
jgi:hypothetical protein